MNVLESIDHKSVMSVPQEEAWNPQTGIEVAYDETFTLLYNVPLSQLDLPIKYVEVLLQPYRNVDDQKAYSIFAIQHPDLKVLGEYLPFRGIIPMRPLKSMLARFEFGTSFDAELFSYQRLFDLKKERREYTDFLKLVLEAKALSILVYRESHLKNQENHPFYQSYFRDYQRRLNDSLSTLVERQTLADGDDKPVTRSSMYREIAKRLPVISFV